MQAAPPCGEAAYGTVVERGRIEEIASYIFNNDSFIEIGTKTRLNALPVRFRSNNPIKHLDKDEFCRIVFKGGNDESTIYSSTVL